MTARRICALGVPRAPASAYAADSAPNEELNPSVPTCLQNCGGPHRQRNETVRRSGQDRLDIAPYEAFRAGLLRHIGVEEKILVPFARRKCSDAALAVARQLKLDHAALVALLVPAPSPAIVNRIRSLLAVHNAREEGDGGFYGICEDLAGPNEGELVRRAQGAPKVRLAAHYDGPRAFTNIERLLRAAGRLSD